MIQINVDSKGIHLKAYQLIKMQFKSRANTDNFNIYLHGPDAYYVHSLNIQQNV